LTDKKAVKGLILLLLFSSFAFAKECPSIDEDFISYYGALKDGPILGLKASISGAKKDRILCSSESCGSGGCECALYVEVDNCLTRVLEFRGSHKVLGEKADGMPLIEVIKKGDAIAPTSMKTFIWNKDRRKYVEKSK